MKEYIFHCEVFLKNQLVLLENSGSKLTFVLYNSQPLLKMLSVFKSSGMSLSQFYVTSLTSIHGH